MIIYFVYIYEHKISLHLNLIAKVNV